MTLITIRAKINKKYPLQGGSQMPKPDYYDSKYFPKTIIVGVHAPYNKTKYLDSYLDEFENLVKTSGTPYEKKLFIKIRDIDSAYFFTKGKLEQLKDECDTLKIEHVIISESLTPQQARNLEDFLNVELFDRTDLILDIFEKAANSAEGKTQVAIAKWKHKKTRLAGKGIHFDQQTGTTGLRGGPGEMAKERERRYIENEIRKLKKRLEKLQKIRATQRKTRLENKVTQICLIGYTNAGKSTILNILTKSDVLAEDKLFATLDTTTRALFIDGKQKGVLSDTVGFIQQLPHHLIEAFKSTLSELQFADLLIQVVDLSDQNWESHIAVVQKILNDLDIQKEMLYVFNKSDLVNNLNEIIPQLELYQPHVIISSLSKKELKPLTEFLSLWKK